MSATQRNKQMYLHVVRGSDRAISLVLLNTESISSSVQSSCSFRLGSLCEARDALRGCERVLRTYGLVTDAFDSSRTPFGVAVFTACSGVFARENAGRKRALSLVGDRDDAYGIVALSTRPRVAFTAVAKAYGVTQKVGAQLALCAQLVFCERATHQIALCRQLELYERATHLDFLSSSRIVRNVIDRVVNNVVADAHNALLRHCACVVSSAERAW